jgi:serine/threonine protein phosphatase PrpC
VLRFIRKIFGGRKSDPTDVKTAPLSEEQVKAVSIRQVEFEPPQLIVGVGASVGKQREHNEDTLFAMSMSLAGTIEAVPFGIFIIADGMGGHQNGEIASGIATRTMASHLIQKIYYPFLNIKVEDQAESFQEIMHHGVSEAQHAVIKQVPGGGTTLTTALIVGSQVTLAHVGDSRAYFIFPDGRMQSITRDHSLVKRLIELGQITEKEAVIHPQRNVLYRAIGQGEPFEPDINTFPLPRPGYLMLCTDGLWGVVPDLDIYRIITNASSPTLACHDLIEAANAAGGPDNITVILIQNPN